jgi:competence protein ComEC
MRPKQLYIISLLSFLVGIVIGSLYQVPNFYLFIITAVCIITIAVLYFKHSKRWVYIVLCLSLLVGVWRAQSVFVPSSFSSLFGSQIELKGLIVEPPHKSDNLQQLLVRLSGYKDLVLVNLPKGIDYEYGDLVQVKGKITEPKEFSGFNYAKYLQSKEVRAVMYRPQVLVLKTKQANPLWSILFQIKDGFSKRVLKLVSGQSAGIVLGMLIGSDDYISKSIQLLFQQDGLTHVLVVSGFNISLLVVCVEFLAPFLGRRLSSLIGLLLIIFYSLIAGLSASVLRAAIMGCLLLLAWVFKRAYNIIPAILLAASVMVFLNPTMLLWDVGFQLSFVATLGIVLATPLVADKYFSKLPKFLSQMLSVSLVAYIVTIPLLLFNFGTLSLVAPIANLLVLPVVPIIMLLGFGVVLPLLGYGAAFLVKSLTSLVLGLMNIIAKIPGGYIQLPINLFQFLCLIGLIIVGYLLLLWSGSKNSTTWEKTLIE